MGPLAPFSTPSLSYYFPSYVSKAGVPLVDGGTWANNPAAVAAVEAVGVLEWDRNEVEVLSLGCTQEPFDARRAQSGSRGLLYWATKARELFASTQSSSAKGMAKQLLGKESVIRYNPTVPSGQFGMDSVDGISALKGLDKTEARKALPDLLKQFFVDHADSFVPCHELEDAHG